MNKPQRALLERIAGRKVLLTRAITASGGATLKNLKDLIADGLVETCDHPTVLERRFGDPEHAVRLTEKGRRVL